MVCRNPAQLNQNINKQNNQQEIRKHTAVQLTVYPERRLELVFLKEDLVHRLLDGREVEVGLGDDDAGVGKVHLQGGVDLDLQSFFFS